MSEKQTISAELVTTGTEILLGEIVDTNAAWIAQQLREIGVNLYYKTTVGDNEPRMRGVLELGLSRSDVILVTGGLGPTVDDITRDAIANATGRSLIPNEAILDKLRKRFARWGTGMTENNQRQAFIPEGAIVVENPVGTAPGFIVESEQGTIIAMPGVPREMKQMVTNAILPYLQKRTGGVGVIRRRILRTIGIGESSLDSRIHDLMHSANPSVGLAAHTGQADVRITARAATASEAESLIDGMEEKLRSRIGEFVYSTTPDEKLETVLVRLLRQGDATVALLDTVTGGAMAQRLLDAARTVPGPNPVMTAWTGDSDELPGELASLLAWKNLGEETLDEAVAGRVASTLRQCTGATFGLVTLGTGRPEEGFYSESTGETWLAVAGSAGVQTSHFPFGGSDEITGVWVGNRALDLVRRNLVQGRRPLQG